MFKAIRGLFSNDISIDLGTAPLEHNGLLPPSGLKPSGCWVERQGILSRSDH